MKPASLVSKLIITTSFVRINNLESKRVQMHADAFVEKRNEIHVYLEVKCHSNLFINLLLYVIYLVYLTAISTLTILNSIIIIYNVRLKLTKIFNHY